VIFKLKKEKEYLVKNLIYPVPDPNFPFLGVHFTRMAKGGVEAGPNAVLAFQREGYKKNRHPSFRAGRNTLMAWVPKGGEEILENRMGRNVQVIFESRIHQALQILIPEIQEHDLETGGAGVRAQACDRQGGLVDDFLILEERNAINVCNAPSPAATSSLAIGETVAALALKRLEG